MTTANQTREATAADYAPTPAEIAAEERSNRVGTAAWLAGLSAFFGFMTFSNVNTIGAGIAFVGVAAMVTVVCCFILRSK
jgi:hypothetical protein